MLSNVEVVRRSSLVEMFRRLMSDDVHSRRCDDEVRKMIKLDGRSFEVVEVLKSKCRSIAVCLQVEMYPKDGEQIRHGNSTTYLWTRILTEVRSSKFYCGSVMSPFEVLIDEKTTTHGGSHSCSSLGSSPNTLHHIQLNLVDQYKNTRVTSIGAYG